MRILRNDIISIANNTVLVEGEYRVLDVFVNSGHICLFAMNQKKNGAKPILLDAHDLNSLVEANVVEKSHRALPMEMLMEDGQLSPSNLEARNSNYALIQELVENPSFLESYCMTGRSKAIVEHAEKMGATTLQIYRALRKFWEYGQVPNALLNFSSLRGGRGKDKKSSSKQRGRPIDHGIYGLRKKTSINVTKQDKENILVALSAQLNKRKKITFTKAYDTYKVMFCEYEIERAVAEKRPAQIVSYDQFLYWANKLMAREEMVKQQMTDSAFSMNQTGSSSSVNDKFVSPGMRYEIDSTTADVYIVCEVSRERVLGRPTIYFVVDVASRMIVGLHISMEYASWNAARQALFNACMPKVEYCERYGISITDQDWPCQGMPATLMADRAEMLGIQPFIFAKNVGTILTIAPPYRGDFKSIVERRFGILNEEIHFMPGTTLGELRKRGEPDYRLDAALTVNSFTKIIIDLVLEHNRFRPFDDLLTRELIQSDAALTPLNYWNFYTSRFQCSLKTFSSDHFVARLMKQGEASVTQQGIIFRGLRYSCKKATEEGWATTAANGGSWKLECRYDESWSTDIYIREPNATTFLKCKLLSSESVYENLHQADVTFINEWKKGKSEDPYYDQSKIQRAKRTKNTIKEEINLTAAVAGTVSKNSRVVNINAHRRQHLEDKKPKYPDVKTNTLNQQVPNITTKLERMKNLFESARDEEL